jgi:predicted NACHT family NTPase
MQLGEEGGTIGRDRARSERMHPLPALDALRLTSQLALLGDAGAGKSTFARIVIAPLAEGNPPPGLSADPLPVLVVLRDLAPCLATIDLKSLPGARHDDPLADTVRDQMIADLAGFDACGFAEELLEALNARRSLLVFGLDEVPHDWCGLVRRGIVAIVNCYRPPRVIVTCRQRSYVEEAVLPGFDAFTLAPFDAEQTKTFAQAWYNAQKDLGRVDAVQAEHKAADLTRAALTPDLRELASNPMLLTTMALIHQQEVGLPKERVHLYSRAWVREFYARAAEGVIAGTWSPSWGWRNFSTTPGTASDSSCTWSIICLAMI